MIASAADEFPDQRFRGHQSGVDALQRLKGVDHIQQLPPPGILLRHRLEKR